jgi:hypothetical protein
MTTEQLERPAPATVIRLRLRPFPVRLARHYLVYRRLGISRWNAARFAWLIARTRYRPRRDAGNASMP